jgi:hypothetical protein
LSLRIPCCPAFITGLLTAFAATAAPAFGFPTANHAIDGGEKFFVGTAGKPWTSGQFGCVRSEGHQFHEGIDIRCLERDRRGEPTDPVLASADGTVAYINSKPGLSNYGRYVVLRHRIEGMEIYSLYAHLANSRAGLKVGDTVTAGSQIGTMGRTSNTQQSITKDRAHCHFEIDMVVHDRFSEWHRRKHPGERNDHGNFNGHNLLGVDPAAVLREEQRLGSQFSLVRFLASQPELCRVGVRATHFPWIRRYQPLIQANPVAAREGVAGYELSMNFNGIPVRIIPRAASELKFTGRVGLLSVNPQIHDAHPCAGIVRHQGNSWALTKHGQDLIDLLVF